MKRTSQPRKLHSDRITVCEIESEMIVYDERTHRAWCLNAASACIWQLCDGRATVSDLVVEAAKKLGPDVSDELVLLTIEELQTKGLLEGGDLESRRHGASRRVMIQRLGLATAALLPVVAAITSPPALAQGGSVGTNTKPVKRGGPTPASQPNNKPSPSRDDDAYSR